MTSRLDTMRAMAEKQPGNPLARFGYANELLKTGDHAAAAAELAAYLAMHDDEGNGWLRYADTLRQLGREEEARAVVARGMDAATRHRHQTLVAEFEERLEAWG
ncbi:MAG: tetratricopeptide repeat protein [Gemmatimonadetes bacterium]|nr:tetratricopeptide repeat protein [Gemmatimonadota bacterium]